MKTLVISVDHPLPEDKGSKIRTMNFARCFSRYGDVDLMCYRMYSHDTTTGFFRKEHFVEFEHEETLQGSIFSSIYEKLILKKPWLVGQYSGKVINYINSIIKKEDYDIILCRYIVNAYPLCFLPAEYKRRVIMDIDDIMSDDLYKTVYSNGKGLGKIKSYVDSRVLIQYQRKCCSTFGNVLFCSDADKVSLTGRKTASKAHVVPNIVPGVKMADSYRLDGYKNLNVMIFVGALCYGPNKEGITWFLENIYTSLRREFSELKLIIVGKDPCDDLKRQICKYDNVELVASPPDVVPYYEMSGVVIVPLRAGGGTRIKILEAGLVNRPVISTQLGAHGLDLKDRREIAYFEDAETFKAAYRWLRDEANYRHSVSKLNSHVRTNYSVNVFNAKMQTIIQS